MPLESLIDGDRGVVLTSSSFVDQELLWRLNCRFPFWSGPGHILSQTERQSPFLPDRGEVAWSI
jgi:hypothetical protein